MHKSEIKEKDWDKIIGILGSFPEIEEATLYGSRAMGTQTPYSDIDITLMGKELNLSVLSKIDIALDDLLLPYRFDLSLFQYISSAELLGHIIRNGQILYKKTLEAIPA
jgi:predicted nucleotidyltransferase